MHVSIRVTRCMSFTGYLQTTMTLIPFFLRCSKLCYSFIDILKRFKEEKTDEKNWIPDCIPWVFMGVGLETLEMVAVYHEIGFG